MKTKHIILLTILTLGGLTVNREIFSAQLPHRAVPVPAVRSTPVPRPVITPTPAPVPPAVEPIAISCETSAASNIAVTVRAGQTGAPAGFSIQWMTLADYVALGSNAIMCATLPCVGSSCTYTQGYWRTHPDAWPVTSLTLGTVTYQAAELKIGRAS